MTIHIKSIRDKPPKINTQDAIQLLNYVLSELQKDPKRCLTATGKVNTLKMKYERTIQ